MRKECHNHGELWNVATHITIITSILPFHLFYVLLTTREAEWYIISAVSVSLSVCHDDNFRKR